MVKKEAESDSEEEEEDSDEDDSELYDESEEESDDYEEEDELEEKGQVPTIDLYSISFIDGTFLSLFLIDLGGIGKRSSCCGQGETKLRGGR